jgi:DNA-directed RNA polymerase subunit L
MFDQSSTFFENNWVALKQVDNQLGKILEFSLKNCGNKDSRTVEVLTDILMRLRENIFKDWEIDHILRGNFKIPFIGSENIDVRQCIKEFLKLKVS